MFAVYQRKQSGQIYTTSRQRLQKGIQFRMYIRYSGVFPFQRFFYFYFLIFNFNFNLILFFIFIFFIQE